VSDPQPLSDFVKECQDLIERIVDTQDVNMKAMLTRKLFEKLSSGRRGDS